MNGGSSRVADNMKEKWLDLTLGRLYSHHRGKGIACGHLGLHLDAVCSSSRLCTKALHTRPSQALAMSDQIFECSVDGEAGDMQGEARPRGRGVSHSEYSYEHNVGRCEPWAWWPDLVHGYSEGVGKVGQLRSGGDDCLSGLRSLHW